MKMDVADVSGGEKFSAQIGEPDACRR